MLQYFEPENSLLPEYSHSDWALTCAWLFASILLDMLLGLASQHSKARRAQVRLVQRVCSMIGLYTQGAAHGAPGFF